LTSGWVHLLNRGVKRPERDVLIVREERLRAYLEVLAGLFRSLTDAEVTSGSYRSISIEESALSDFDVSKKWNDGAT